MSRPLCTNSTNSQQPTYSKLTSSTPFPPTFFFFCSPSTPPPSFCSTPCNINEDKETGLSDILRIRCNEFSGQDSDLVAKILVTALDPASSGLVLQTDLHKHMSHLTKQIKKEVAAASADKVIVSEYNGNAQQRLDMSGADFIAEMGMDTPSSDRSVRLTSLFFTRVFTHFMITLYTALAHTHPFPCTCSCTSLTSPWRKLTQAQACEGCWEDPQSRIYPLEDV